MHEPRPTREFMRPLIVSIVGAIVMVGLGVFMLLGPARSTPSDTVPLHTPSAAQGGLRPDPSNVKAPAQPVGPEAEAAKAALSARVHAWDSLLESIATSDTDKTAEIESFLTGPPDEVKQVAADYQDGWSANAQADEPFARSERNAVIQRIDFNEGLASASVVETDEVTLDDGVVSPRLMMETWYLIDGQWLRTSFPAPWWAGGTGRRPIDQGTQVGYVVFAPEAVQKIPPSGWNGDSDALLIVDFDVRNQELITDFPGDYAIRLWDRDGTSYDVSPLSEEVMPGSTGDRESPLEPGVHRTDTVVFKVPADIDLTSLEFEVIPAETTPGTDDTLIQI